MRTHFCNISNLPIIVFLGLFMLTAIDRAHASESDPFESSCAAVIGTEDPIEGMKKSIEKAKSMMKHGDKICAWRIMGDAACILKDIKLADQAYRRLDASGREFLAYRCGRNGIQRVHGHFKIIDE